MLNISYVLEAKMEKYNGTLFIDGTLTYKGEILNEKPEGKGVLTKTNTWVYEGEFKNGERHGKGTITYLRSGEVYVGDWKNDKRDGLGTWFADDTSSRIVYEGEWKNDLPHGKGKRNYTEDYYYDGEWVNGKEDGYGVKKARYGIYTGTFQNGKRHGTGKCEFIDGSVYEGTWTEDCIDGHGKLYSDNGKVFVGNWNNDQKNKTGELILTNGEVVKGKWDSGYAFTFDSKFKTGLKLYIYYNEELTGNPEIIDLDNCKSEKWIKDRGSSSAVIQFLYTYFGYCGFSAKFRFDEGYDSSNYPTSIMVGEIYLYSWTDVDITGPTDWEESGSRDYKWLVIRKE